MVTSYEIADMFLRAIGAPRTTSNRRAISIWLKWEGGGSVSGNNPWNLHSGPDCGTGGPRYCPGYGAGRLPGQIGTRWAGHGTGDKNVAVFDTLEHGVQANARNLSRNAAGYPAAISALRSGSGYGFLVAIQKSGWAAGHYAYHFLTDAFNHGGGKNYTLAVTNYGSGSTGTVPPSTGGNGENVGFQPGFDWSRITIDALQALGISTDANHTINHDEALKLATLWPTTQYPVDIIARQFEGKKVGELLELAKGIDINVGKAIKDVGKQLTDTFTWIGIIILGLVFIGGGIFLFGIGPSKSEL